MSLVLLRAADTNATPAGAALSGSGALTSPQLAEFRGAGAFATASTLQIEDTTGSLGGTGTLVVNASRVIQLNATLTLLESDLERAPTTLTVVANGGWPSDDVEFDIDGTGVATAVLDSEGGLAAQSINVDETFGLGAHTLTMTSLTLQPGSTTSVSFTLNDDAAVLPDMPASDAPAEDVPEAGTDVRRWVFQDLSAGGLGSYVMPYNPTTMTAPEFQRQLEQQHSTAVDTGQFHIFEGGASGVSWEFSGYLDTQEMYEALDAFCSLRRRFFIIDHRGRAWKVAAVNFDARPRKRQANTDGTFNDWAHDYTVSALIYDQQWVTPA